MQNRIEVSTSTLKDNTLEFQLVDNNIEISSMKVTGQMLVDSDNLSFIYIVETNDEYVYLSFPTSVWGSLRKLIEDKLIPVLRQNGQEIVLEGIAEELTYLVQNIEGNANYGEEMVSMVEETFIK
ncbi:UPF0738 family protein [Litchfieldia alkalitelluris]|uniref:UPF0738 family protein n=1 Tax=Litchfieldia alkalitelluris TaxID=304268 RepID=UPI000997FF2B|nr:hypothetical protein [Litchfieldia alkalitelluris]